VGPRVVFIVDEAQELKPAVLETIRGLWDRGEHARQGYVTKSAFGWVPVGNEMFMGKGGNLRVARFRPLMPRLTASVHLPRPDKKEIAALAAALFPGCVEWQTEALIEACSADNPDIPAILLALSTLATYAHNAVMVDDAVAQSIGRASPVHLKGGPVQ
jgi:hypothetical protein